MTTESQENSTKSAFRFYPQDLLAGTIVFLVALPLCLGIALASGAPAFSGIIAGIAGGLIVGILSGSHTSVSGPAAGMTAIVAAQITRLGTFETFLLAVVIAGVFQIGLGIIRAGSLSAFFPSSVIKGLLAAIGVILILKQIPHLLGHDKDPVGDMAFEQPDHKNTFSEIAELFQGDIHSGAALIGIGCLVFLLIWDRFPNLKKFPVPAPLLVVLIGVFTAPLFSASSSEWRITSDHLVNVPVAQSVSEFGSFLIFPDFTQWLNPAVYLAAATIAIVASLETLLNLDAVDKLDKKQRLSPPSRELWAQGVGNITSGLFGGIPITSVIIRGSVNIHSGSQSKFSAIFHGLLLLVCVALFPAILNRIPISCLAAILLQTGFKLASPKLFKRMWSEGKYQFIPFILTLIAIVFTDLLIGIVIGMIISLVFILNSNLRRPIRHRRESHMGKELIHVELANQVSFLNRAALEQVLRSAPAGATVHLDARRTDYIDPDILSMIREFQEVTAPVFDIQVELLGFLPQFGLESMANESAGDRRTRLASRTPAEILDILLEGNKRFYEDHPLDPSLREPESQTIASSVPLAAICTGIDACAPVEIIFDLSLGDAYVIRVPGIVTGPRVVGGLEFAVQEGVKLIVVMGHTGSRLVTRALREYLAPGGTAVNQLTPILASLQDSIREFTKHYPDRLPRDVAALTPSLIDEIAETHIQLVASRLTAESPELQQAVNQGRVQIVAAMYNTKTRKVQVLSGEHREPIAALV